MNRQVGVMGVTKGRGRVSGPAHVWWRHSRREHERRSAASSEQTPQPNPRLTQTQVSAGSSHHTRDNVLNCHRSTAVW